MGQCICTFATLPCCCVGFSLARQWRVPPARAACAGAALCAIGGAAFTLMSYQCGGVDFVGGGGNDCWSEGSSKAETLGMASAGGLGLGAPLLLGATVLGLRPDPALTPPSSSPPPASPAP